MCIFDTIKRSKGWREDPNLSFNDNLFFGSVHFVQVFFGKYRVVRHNNDDFDDLASDCSLAVYEAAKRNLDKWDREKYRMDHYLYGRAWSVVGNFLRCKFNKKSREPVDVRFGDGKRLTPIDYDVGLDELESNNYEQGTRYTVFRSAPLNYEEKKLTEDELEYVRMVDDCVYEGLPIPTLEDFDLEDSEHKATIKKILGENYVG